jgi:hypothetical protein
VSERQLARYPSGSAEHALLELWQAVQFSDVEGARRLVSPAAVAAMGRSRFSTLVETIGDNIPGLQILSTQRRGATASVRVYLRFYKPDGSVSAISPMTFMLHRGAQAYKLADLSFLSRRAQEILAAQRAAPHQ